MTTDEVSTTEPEAPVATQGIGISCTLRSSDLKGLVFVLTEATCLEVHLHRVEGGRIERSTEAKPFDRLIEKSESEATSEA